MALRKILAREFSWAVSDGVIPTFLAIGGLTSFTPSPAKTDATTTDFDSNGWAEHMVAGRSLAFTLDGMYLEDPADGSRDLGQERVEELGLLTGAGSLEQFTITTPGGTVLTFYASVNVSPVSTGGGTDDAGEEQAEQRALPAEERADHAEELDVAEPHRLLLEDIATDGSNGPGRAATDHQAEHAGQQRA